MESLQGPSDVPDPSLNFKPQLPPDILTTIFIETVLQNLSHSEIEIIKLKLITKADSFDNHLVKYLATFLNANHHYQQVRHPILTLLKEKIAISSLISENHLTIFNKIVFQKNEEKQEFISSLITAHDNLLFKFFIKKPDFEQSLDPVLLLTTAFEQQNVEIFQFITEKFLIDPSLENNKFTIEAAKKGHSTILTFLLSDKRTNPAAQDNEALKQAAAFNQLNTLHLLLQDSRTDPTAEENYAIKIAIQEGFKDIVSALLNDGRINPLEDNCLFIKFAMFHDQAEVTRLLLNYVDPNEVLFFAIENGLSNILKILLEDSRLNLEDQEFLTLQLACEAGDLETLKELLNFTGIPPNFDHDYLMRWASFYGHEAIVEYLLTLPDVDPQACNNEAIKAASAKGYENIVKLLAKKENISEALLEACRQKHLQIIDLLLEYPEINLIPSLKLALQHGYEDICYSLLISPYMPEPFKVKYAKYLKYYQ